MTRHKTEDPAKLVALVELEQQPMAWCVCEQTEAQAEAWWYCSVGPLIRTGETLKTKGSLRVERGSEKGQKNKTARMIALARQRQRQIENERKNVCVIVWKYDCAFGLGCLLECGETEGVPNHLSGGSNVDVDSGCARVERELMSLCSMG